MIRDRIVIDLKLRFESTPGAWSFDTSDVKIHHNSSAGLHHGDDMA